MRPAAPHREEVPVTHACAGCRLRFTHASELAEHVRTEHSTHEPFVERQETVLRQRWAARAKPVPRP